MQRGGPGLRGRLPVACSDQPAGRFGALLLLAVVACAPDSNASDLPDWKHPSALVEGSGGLLSSDRPGRTVFLGEDPVCGTCAIDLRPLGTFGAPSDTILLRGLPVVERDSHGRFYATTPFETGEEVILYDSEGEIVRTVGRSGQGPGEFLAVNDIRVIPGDTLLIAHDWRVSWFDSTGHFVHGIRLEPPPSLPMPRRISAREEGGLAMVEIQRTDTLHRPIHRYDEDGQYLGPAGPAHELSEAYRGAGGFAGRLRRTTWDSEGNLWALGPGYRIERSDPSGRLTRVIGVVGPAEWGLELHMSPQELEAQRARLQAQARGDTPPDVGGPRADAPASPREAGPPTTVVMDVTLPDPDLLLVAIHVPARSYRDARDLSAVHELYDTQLDLIDVPSGVVLARTRVPGRAHFTSDGALHAPREDATGVITFEAWEVRLHLDPRDLEALRGRFGTHEVPGNGAP
jgi:hypothetical protein